MKQHLAIVFVLSIFVVPAAEASDVSWMFRPGYYTHSPETGQRVAQYEPERPSIIPTDPTYQESGYRHQVIQLGTDYLNLVQTWGAGTAIRPYGEWERPYRPGATPYGPWIMPYRAWQNPYGPANGPFYGYGANPYGGALYGLRPEAAGGWQGWPGGGPRPSPISKSGTATAPPMESASAPHGQEL
jgi:hypothetical protein